VRKALFWVITQRVVVNFADLSGQPIGPFGFLTPEGGTDRLSRNVQQKLPLLAA